VIGTEAEFRTKRCTPALALLVARAVNFESYQASVVSENVGVGLNCIGSKCAQWCWYDYANAQGETHFANEGAAQLFQRGRRSSVGDSAMRVPARGYCGLTGSRE
jgi:hypothetical protein